MLHITKKAKILILRAPIPMVITLREERIPTMVTIRLIKNTSARHLSQRIKRKWLERSPKQTGRYMI
jgi:hypothetical protein